MLKKLDKVPKCFGWFVRYKSCMIISGGGKMKLGEKILQLRKEKGLSQEQLG